MEIIDPQKLVALYEARDLDALNRLAIPAQRALNKDDTFSSVLMLSAHRIKHLLKIPTVDADCIILNLEDGVSKEEKPFALVLCGIFLAKYKSCNKKLVVRVNPLDEGGVEEIRYITRFMPDAIRVSKVKDKNDIDKILKLVDKDIDIHLSIETAQAWNNMLELGKDSRVKVFYLGILDLLADLNLPQSLLEVDNPTIHYMLSHFLVSSSSVGVKAVSFNFQDFKNLDMFSRWLELEKSMGFMAKGCISPKQAELVNSRFVVKLEDMQKAKEIIKLFENNLKDGASGFVSERFGFIDEPIYKDALNLIKH